MFKFSLLFIASLILAIAIPVYSQQCSPPAIVVNNEKDNLFTPEQEMILGEMTLASFAREFPQVLDPVLQKYVDELGARIVKHLPETGLKFTFHIIDYPQANAFNIPGGHVFLSRKLIALSANEDELASVIGHELGHATVHHSAKDISYRMRKILNVTALGNRKDVIDKYNRLIENARTKRVTVPGGHEDGQQLEADRIGLYAMVAAGYDPIASFTFFDRLTESDGKTGGWFGNLFGTAKPAQKRLREIQEATGKLPQECRDGRKATMADEYLQFQAEVIMYRPGNRKEILPGLLWKRELKNKVRSEIDHFEFTRDGTLLLAQDDFGATVIDHKAKKILLQIPVKGLKEASFTPDGKHVVLTTDELRFERWDIATGKPIEAREVIVRSDCVEHKLSPDGNYIACAALGEMNSSEIAMSTLSGIAMIIDTKTGKRVWEDNDFYRISIFEFVRGLIIRTGGPFFRIEFTPDSRYVMFSRSDHHRYRFVTSGSIEKSDDTAKAIDLSGMKPVSLDGPIKKISAGPYLFLDSERILGKSGDADSAGVFSFPSGKRLQQFTFGGRQVTRTGNPDYVIVKPLIQSRLGIFDIKRGTLLSGLNKADAAIFGDLIAFEGASGEVVFRESKYNEAEKGFDGKDVITIEVPPNAIGRLTAVDVSDNFEWLALSTTTKGGLWNVPSGERKVTSRGFRGALAGDDGGALGHFPKLREEQQTIALMNPTNNQVLPLREVSERGNTQYGRFVLTRTSRAKKEKEKEEKPRAAGAVEVEDNSDLIRNVRFAIKDIVRNEVIWTRDFDDRAPYYSFDQYSGRLILYWTFASDEAKALQKQYPELKPKVDSMGSKLGDYLIEVIDAFSQKTIGVLPLETGRRSFDIGNGLSEGDWLVVNDNADRILVYSLKEGVLKHRFFGAHAAINPARNFVAVENFPGEINLYDLESGESRGRLIFNSGAAFIRFNLAGDKLFVLSDSQQAYAFDLNKAIGTSKSTF